MAKRWCTYEICIEDSSGEETYNAVFGREISSDDDIPDFQKACRKKVESAQGSVSFDGAGVFEAIHDGLSALPDGAKRA